MLRIGASSMFFHEYALETIFHGISASGLDTVEFWLETPSFWTTGQSVPELIETLSEYPSLLPITVHAPVLDLNPVSINPGIAAFSVESACEAIRVADQLQAEVITIHPGRRTAKRPPSAADMHRFSLYMEAVEAQSRDVSVTIAIENMEPRVNALLTTPESVASVLDDYPHLSLTFDYAHASAGESGAPEEFVNLCSDRIVNVHASSGSPADMHSPLGRTEAMNACAALLSSFSYDGPVIFEIEDLGLKQRPSFEEKCAILSGEAAAFWDAAC
ncbi:MULTISPECIES: sugar phosphate isomerase/epimerase [Methanocalculus]|uniref:sugar phosphate isomerase/epimerase family protein n=1 Tax=Methanocalculus TaxID=71151 RepID=UPI0020A1C4FA|nr:MULTISPECIES: sugar phosphate isomerase/epimerase family protein [unclassified Methanocalculus]MCP1662067.1 sugar phosphate isomerase/epimerase [Methanocalculus sp. AMF5]